MNYHLKRRGYDLGVVTRNQLTPNNDELSNWQKGQPVLLKEVCLSELGNHQTNIEQAYSLYQSILDEEECEPILIESPYNTRLEYLFESLGCSVNEGDNQEIETVLFDVVENDNVLAEDLWMKISWLSFYEQDASLRFRFSFGIDLAEDVAADKQRQHYAALLADAVFPESRLITDNKILNEKIEQVLGDSSVNFVERIVYFNSPGGGAYLHHDRERGHAGVVYAQVSGSTFWLALPKHQLITEISSFIKQCATSNQWPETIDSLMKAKLNQLASDQEKLSSELDSFSNNTLIHLINETEAFIQQLIHNGHGRIVEAGDALLLPQETAADCCWHTVFTLGDETGEALSFAIRRHH